MESIDINGIIEKFKYVLKQHELGTGQYCRFLWQDALETRKMGLNAYGCADAANIMYTLGELPRNTAVRENFINKLQDLQNPKTGLFLESSHHIIHTTAHCVAALELFDERPRYPLYELEQYRDIERFFAWMEREDWLHRGRMAHPGAGLFAAMFITESIDDAWVEKYFNWFDKTCDKETGLWVSRPVENFPVHLQMGDAFHYLFNYEYMKRPFPYPEQLIDSCLEMYNNGQMPESFGKDFHFIEMDWVYCLNRASRQTPYRFAEIKETLSFFAEHYIEYLKSVDYETNEGANDLHLLFGTLCCLSELQLALPGKIISSKPLRLVLDRRPFI